jgi:hypothetical protein
MVLSGSSVAAAAHAAGSRLGVAPMVIAEDGGGSGMGTPRAMETEDAPGGLPSAPKAAAAAAAGSTLKLSTSINIVAASNAAMQQQQQEPHHHQQQQAPAPFVAHHRHSSGGLDVLVTGGLRGQADQATLGVNCSPIKPQLGPCPAAAAAATGGYGPAAGMDSSKAGVSGKAVAAFLAQQQKQQQQQHGANASMWAPAGAAAREHKHQHSEPNATGSFTQQQQQHQSQALLMQQQLDMAVVGQGVGSNKQQLGTVLMDRLLPRLQH